MAQPVFNFTNYTTCTGDVIRTGSAILGGVTINIKGTAGSTIQLRDSTSSSTGDIIASIDVGTSLGTFVYDVATVSGLSVWSSSATADFTVEWA